MGAVASVVLGWGVAQYPYILPTSMKLSAAAAPDATLWSVVIVFVIAALVILPSLGLLYYLDQRDLLAVPTTEPGLDDGE
jgi:cytochrome d ubiquinol oxidase subunit II